MKALAMVRSLLVVALLAAGLTTVDAQRVPVPNISMPTLDGGQWSLKENAGRVVVLNF